MKTLLILALMLQACGKDDNQTTSTKAESTTTNVSNKQAAVAMAVASESELPTCTSTNTYQLVYVQSVKSFFSCSSSGWKLIEITAPVTYVKGDKGDKGESGNTPNTWIDPVTGNTFFIAAAVSTYGWGAGSICLSPYRMATSTEILNAYLRGLGLQMTALGANITAWYTSVSYINMSTGVTNSITSTHTILCVK